MRAKYPMEQVKGDWARSKVLDPKQADDILFEMFVHGWIDQDHSLHVTKYTLPELAKVIEDGKPISIESGRRLAQWSKGATTLPPTQTNAADPAGLSPSLPRTHESPADLDAFKAEIRKLATPGACKTWGITALKRADFQALSDEDKDAVRAYFKSHQASLQ